MLFSRINIEKYYSVDEISKFYDILSKEFDGLELIWKSKYSKRTDPENSEYVIIKINGKTLFSLQSRNGKGFFAIKQAKGKEKELLRILRECNFEPSRSDQSTAYACLAGFSILMLIVVILGDPVIKFILAPFLTAIILGLSIVVLRAKKMIESEYSAISIGSIIFLIGIVGTVPSALLLIPFINHMNGKVYDTMMNVVD